MAKYSFMVATAPGGDPRGTSTRVLCSSGGIHSEVTSALMIFSVTCRQFFILNEHLKRTQWFPLSMLARFRVHLRKKFLPEYNALLLEVEQMRRDDVTARAQLLQLRVWNTSNVHGRTGFMVSAFIPQEVLQRLVARPEKQPAFVSGVAEALVKSAVNGLVHQATQGEVTALVFSPPGKGIVQQVAKIETRPHGDFVISRKTVEQAAKDMQKKLDGSTGSDIVLPDEADLPETEDRKKSLGSTLRAAVRKAKACLLSASNWFTG